METLSLQELKLVRSALVRYRERYATRQSPRVNKTLEKIRQAIADKEFEEKRLQF